MIPDVTEPETKENGLEFPEPNIGGETPARVPFLVAGGPPIDETGELWSEEYWRERGEKGSRGAVFFSVFCGVSSFCGVRRDW